MRSFKLTHLKDAELLRGLSSLVARDRMTTARVLAYIAEVDERRLYAPAGYSSMYSYCLGELRLSEDAAAKRIHVARAARAFPALFAALADGLLHMAAARAIAPHLTAANASELIADATHRSRAEVEEMLARRFPRAEALRLDDGVVALPIAGDEHAPGHVDAPSSEHAPGHVEPPAPRVRVAPLSPDRYAIQITIRKSTHDKLRHAQALLAHAVPAGDVAEVLDRALDALIAQLEKRKVGATKRPQGKPRPTRGRRHVPAQVRRAVWERDHGQCSFVSHAGRRCDARSLLEFDHVEPVARGGRATVQGIRLRCRAHNQLAAEEAFGAGFMDARRKAARRVAVPKLRKSKPPESRARESNPPESEQTRDVIAGLRGLGLGARVAREAAGLTEARPGTTLEERIRVALRSIGAGMGRVGAAPG